MKKVLIFHHCGQLGGGSLSCLDMIDMLNGSFEVYLGISSPDEAISAMLSEMDIKECIPLGAFPSLTYHNASHSTIKSLVKYFISKKYVQSWVDVAKRVNPDIIILNSSAISPLIEPLTKAGFKTVCVVRETIYSKKTLPVNRLMRGMLKKASAVAYLTQHDLEAWDSGCKKQFVLPDVVNERFFYSTPCCEASEEFTILYMGGLSLAKGIETLADAYELMSSKQKSKLVILGWGSFVIGKKGIMNRLFYSADRQRVLNVMEKLENFNQENKRIEIPGIVKDTSPYYKKADVVCFPVFEIHQPRPAYEAGYYKKPIILPDCPNFKENVTDGVNGLYYEPGNAESLAQKLSLLAEDSLLTKKLGEENHRYTQEKHNLQLVSQILLNELNEIIEE